MHITEIQLVIKTIISIYHIFSLDMQKKSPFIYFRIQTHFAPEQYQQCMISAATQWEQSWLTLPEYSETTVITITSPIYMDDTHYIKSFMQALGLAD